MMMGMQNNVADSGIATISVANPRYGRNFSLIRGDIKMIPEVAATESANPGSVA